VAVEAPDGVHERGAGLVRVEHEHALAEQLPHDHLLRRVAGLETVRTGARYKCDAVRVSVQGTQAGVDPQVYLADVLMRVATHPASRVHELIPARWKEIFAPAS
jgi:hypothetical protein